MDALEILNKIASNLTNRKKAAALSNYKVLCNNIKHLNTSLHNSLIKINDLVNEISLLFNDDRNIQDDFKNDGSMASMKPIVLRLIQNELCIQKRFLQATTADTREKISIPDVSNLSRGFDEYNTLVTSARQFIDSIVSDAYQLLVLKPKSMNYHVLVSLNSFAKYSTKSIRHALFNSEIDNALKEFSHIKFKDWSKSRITECKHQSFAQKIDYLFDSLDNTYDKNLPDDLKNLFKFSSEFTHIGYISTFFTSSTENEVIFGDEFGPYLPSTENFSELKYEILETACKAFYSLYLPSIAKCLQKIVASPAIDTLTLTIGSIVDKIKSDVASRNTTYYFFIKEGLITSGLDIELRCMCGATKKWLPPHRTENLYCDSCGSDFRLIEIEGDSSFIITSNGPCKVIGSSGPDFSDLPVEKQSEILQQIEELRAKC